MDDNLKATLSNWHTLNDRMYDLEEAQVKEMLDYEIINRRRVTFVERLHQRFCTLRTNRERLALMKECQK